MLRETGRRIPGKIYGEFLVNLHTNHIEKGLQGPELPPEDRKLAEAFLTGRRTKFAVDAMVTMAPRKFAPKELAGLVFAMQAINSADHAVDKGRLDTTVYPWEEALNRYPVENSDLTIGTLRGKVREYLPDEKHAMFQEYVSKMVRLHKEDLHFKPGEFNFNQAYEYRERTTGGLAVVSAQLAELAPKRLNLVRRASMVLQWVDDAEDVGPDMDPEAVGNANMYIGMATDLGEYSALRDAATSDRKLSPRQIVKSAPRTRAKYKARYQDELKRIDKRGVRGAVQTIGLWKKVP
jgi:hypothetical protein